MRKFNVNVDWWSSVCPALTIGIGNHLNKIGDTNFFVCFDQVCFFKPIKEGTIIRVIECKYNDERNSIRISLMDDNSLYNDDIKMKKLHIDFGKGRESEVYLTCEESLKLVLLLDSCFSSDYKKQEFIQEIRLGNTILSFLAKGSVYYR